MGLSKRATLWGYPAKISAMKTVEFGTCRIMGFITRGRKCSAWFLNCGASYQGISLNEELLQGPNLTSTLLGIVTRFRREEVAVMADVEAMFHQVKVPDEDSDPVGATSTEDQGDAVLELMQYFSSWIRLKKAVTWMLEIKSTLLSLCQKTQELNTTFAPTEVTKRWETSRQAFWEFYFYFFYLFIFLSFFYFKVSIRRVILCYCHFRK